MDMASSIPIQNSDSINSQLASGEWRQDQCYTPIVLVLDQLESKTSGIHLLTVLCE
jgi:hypothetical protein